MCCFQLIFDRRADGKDGFDLVKGQSKVFPCGGGFGFGLGGEVERLVYAAPSPDLRRGLGGDGEIVHGGNLTWRAGCRKSGTWLVLVNNLPGKLLLQQGSNLPQSAASTQRPAAGPCTDY